MHPPLPQEVHRMCWSSGAPAPVSGMETYGLLWGAHPPNYPGDHGAGERRDHIAASPIIPPSLLLSI